MTLKKRVFGILEFLFINTNLASSTKKFEKNDQQIANY
jgi:hypothetical protein